MSGQFYKYLQQACLLAMKSQPPGYLPQDTYAAMASIPHDHVGGYCWHVHSSLHWLKDAGFLQPVQAARAQGSAFHKVQRENHESHARFQDVYCY